MVHGGILGRLFMQPDLCTMYIYIMQRYIVYAYYSHLTKKKLFHNSTTVCGYNNINIITFQSSCPYSYIVASVSEVCT